MNEINLEAKKRFNIIELKYFIGICITIGIQLICIAIIKNNGWTETLSTNVIFCIEMLPFILIGYPLFLYIVSKTPKNIQIEQKILPVSKIFIYFTIAWAGMYLSNLVGMVITNIIGIITGNPVGNVVALMIDQSNIFIQLLIIVILGPIFEELVFRKFLIDRTAGYGEKVAVILSATVFALYHGNIGQAVYAFVVGLLFGTIYLRTGNIKNTMILHMMINFMGSVVPGLVLKSFDFVEFSKVAGSGDMEALSVFMLENITGVAIYVLYAVCILAIVLTGIVMFFVNRKNLYWISRESDIPKGQVFKTVYVNLGMLLILIASIALIIYQVTR